MEARANAQLKNKLYGEFLGIPANKAYLDRYQALRAANDMEGMKALYMEIEPKLNEMMKGREMKYTDEQKKAYASIGGSPHLDGAYTVFGEVIQGLEVVDKIAAVEVNGSKPIENVVMKLSIIEAK